MRLCLCNFVNCSECRLSSKFDGENERDVERILSCGVVSQRANIPPRCSIVNRERCQMSVQTHRTIIRKTNQCQAVVTHNPSHVSKMLPPQWRTLKCTHQLPYAFFRANGLFHSSFLGYRRKWKTVYQNLSAEHLARSDVRCGTAIRWFPACVKNDGSLGDIGLSQNLTLRLAMTNDSMVGEHG